MFGPEPGRDPGENPMQLDHYRLVREAEDRNQEFRELFKDVEYESEGVLYSEMAFMSLAVSQFEPLRILEAGRGRGQSTELLAKLFADMPVLSVECDQDSENEAVARRRLAGYSNIDCRIGDAQVLLPETSKAGDIVLIDGPSGWPGMKLLFKLLASRKFDLAFIHDVNIGTPYRAFLEKHLPSTNFSDDPEFAEICHGLDEKAKDHLPSANTYEATQGKFGYGLSLACLPYDARINYNSLGRKAGMASLKGSLTRGFGKRS